MSGREKGLMRTNTDTGHVDMSHYKLLMDTHVHKHKSEQRPWGKTQPQSQENKRQGRMLLISIHGPFISSPFVKETLPPVGDTHQHICQGANLNLCTCHRVRVGPGASIFQIDWHTGSLGSAWEQHTFFYFSDFHMEKTCLWGSNSDYGTGSVAIGC